MSGSPATAASYAAGHRSSQTRFAFPPGCRGRVGGNLLDHSYENPEHEAKIKALVNELAPDLSVSASYEVLPQIREVRANFTTATNAYVKPIYGKYLQKLSSRLPIARVRRQTVYNAVQR